ncbi:MAG: riboflavin kinase [Thermoprotei archaeon]|nr:MAG: riboflavin kinase [Thermoprotei archaeon]RLF10951.1 MAG: riboflavin kinase [Thermoprotei archaeon]
MKKWEKISILLELALRGAILSPIEISTVEMAKILGLSQQSVSRKLIRLEEAGLIARRMRRRKSIILITDKGFKLIYEHYLKLRKIFDKTTQTIILRGVAVSGLGEGAYYVTIPYYYEQFKERLGFSPYPGTFNVKLTKDSTKMKQLLLYTPGIEIEGYYDGKRMYGGVKCFRVVINNEIKGALLLIERTHHEPDIVEIIAPVCIRSTLGLSDGDFVVIKVLLNDL